jgi:hypothetical protein
MNVISEQTVISHDTHFYFPCFPVPMVQQLLVGQGLLIIEASQSQSGTPPSVGLLWKSDQPDAETSAVQHTTLTRDRH